jgi:hypothetical protein
VAGKLNTKKLAALKSGTKTADGGGLYAISDPKARITWGFLFTINRRRRLMSLGRWPDVSLATARELATDARRKVRSGIDPIEIARLKNETYRLSARLPTSLLSPRRPRGSHRDRKISGGSA